MVERDVIDDGNDIDAWVKEIEQTEIMEIIKKLDGIYLETNPVIHLSPFFKMHRYNFWVTNLE